ncbi:DUF4283 domain-containing protein/zf-CCHC_4 domain-containing protein, partial [Cephalotus follicularis]
NGVYFVKFDNGQARDWIMDNGPWDIWGYHLTLRKLSKGMSLTLENRKSIPVWVKLFKIPVHFWTKMGLSYIVSVLGKPLHMDLNTTNRYALNFARVCIDMAASSSFPDSIILELEDGSKTTIGVEYPRRPASCNLCKVFDHSNKTCPRVVWREWMPKPEVAAQRKPNDVEGWITVKRKGNPMEQVHQTPTQLELPPSEEVHEVGEEAAKQTPKTPVKSAPNAPEPPATSPDVIRNSTRGDCNEAGCHVERAGVSPRVLLIGSSSGHKKKKKKGHCSTIQMIRAAAWNVRGLNDLSK